MDPRCVQECPGETVQTRLSCRYSHNRLICFISACISNSFGYFMPEDEPNLARYQSIFYTN